MSLIRQRMKPGGIFVLQIDPLYFSPRGSHLYGHLPEPWVHLLQQTSVLYEDVLRSAAGQQEKEREWTQFLELNRTTADEQIAFAVSSGFELIEQKRVHTQLVPPERLLACYSRDVLTTSYLEAAFRA